MKMKEVCERTALTERTVRFYMQKGLIAPQKEWRNGREYSEFSEKDIETLQAVAVLRELTFSIEDIRTMQTTPELIAEIVAEKRDAARISHESAENTFSVLDHLNTDGIESMMMLAERAKEASVHRPHDIAPEPPEEVNQSGMGDRCEKIPYEIMDKWNWGAFWCPLIWGIANQVPQAFLCMIPLVGLFFAFYLGKNGNELAWRHRYWESVDEFKRVQRRWAIWTTVISVLIFALFVCASIMDAKAEKELEDNRVVMLEELKQTEEFKSVVGDRVEWTAKEETDVHWYLRSLYSDAADAEKDDWEAAFDKYFYDYTANSIDFFYLQPEKYYRIYGGELIDTVTMIEGTDVLVDDSSYMCFAFLELSDGTQYDFACDLDSDLNFRSIAVDPVELDEPVRCISLETMKEARLHVKNYVKKRLDEVVASDQWKTTIGDDYTVVEIYPVNMDFLPVYNEKMPECLGLYVKVKDEYDNEYVVIIDVEYDPKTDSMHERPLIIHEAVQ